ncbi:immunoglobulin-like domain-containing protein [Bifidobacterium saguinibicoloris]|uniref:rhamnogalacturonan lyase family protein n=1 Tax=Bifidobacterium saguinibicoloris TaxID=2834433 RepID=UPI001C56A5CA|nr:immunoglobulin-like domain-containing protein [Bifidobacterium saguinibicoloris]MBW3080479.1 DUF5011 domain-containing protein [Bifidobacterium saguinibicoloris]
MKTDKNRRPWLKRAVAALAGAATLGTVAIAGAPAAYAYDGSLDTADNGTSWTAEQYADRALTVVPTTQGVLATWRLYANDAKDTTFTLKRNGAVVYTGTTTNYTDKDGKPGDTYTLSASKGAYGEETATAWASKSLTLKLDPPADQQMPAGQTTGVDQVATYTANDMSTADLDGDGVLDLVVKWDPSNWQDNYYAGFTGTTFLDGYTFDRSTGATKRLWRIDLGVNIRSGAHYTQFQVWDYDGDGKAEVLVKTADGTSTYKDEAGKLVETGHVGAASAEDLPTDTVSGAAKHDYRMTGKASDPKDKKNGKINSGPEYLTAFAGDDGHIIDTTDFQPSRDDGLWHWGPSDANIVDRFLAATAYLDGENGRPYAVFSRGYYFRTEIATYSLQDGKLKLNWHFRANKDTSSGKDPSWVENPDFAQQGFHNLSINDVDGDGKDDIVFGSMTVKSDGTGLASSKLGHGDAQHISDWNDDGVLDTWNVHEGKRDATLTNPATGQVMFRQSVSGDNGRGMAADIDARYPGAELWSAMDANTYNAVTPAPADKTSCTAKSPTPCVKKIYSKVKPASANFSLHWDGDLLDELFEYSGTQDSSITTAHQDRVAPQVQKWNPETQTTDVIWEDAAASTNNGSKGNANLIGDIMGDWRDEIIVRDTKDPSIVRLYSTDIATPYSIATSLQSRSYREGLAWQNTAYNQPAHRQTMLFAGVTVPTVTATKHGADAAVTWTAATDGRIWGVGVGGYRVYRADKGSTEFTAVADVPADTLAYTDTGLDKAKDYTYRVAALIDGNPYYQSFDADTAAGEVTDPTADLVFADGYPQLFDKDGKQVTLTPVSGKTDTYAATVPLANSKVTVKAKAANAGHVVYIGSKKVESRDLTISLEGLNNVHVFVKSADGKLSRDYLLQITRKDETTPSADKTRLNRLIDAYDGEDSALKEDDYTAEAWAAFQKALDAAKAVAADADATQDEVDAAVTALAAAKTKLVTDGRKPAAENKAPVVTLNAGVDAAVTLDYGADFAQPTADDVTVTDDTDADLKATVAITLDGRTVDKIDTTVPGTYTVTYTATDSGKLTGTATRTMTVDEKPAPAINTAKLELAVNEAKAKAALGEDAYIADTWTPFATALAEAEKVLAAPTDQKAVDAAADDLAAKTAALKTKPAVTPTPDPDGDGKGDQDGDGGQNGDGKDDGGRDDGGSDADGKNDGSGTTRRLSRTGSSVATVAAAAVLTLAAGGAAFALRRRDTDR